MGNQPSSQVDEASNGDSRCASPLPGEDGDYGYDGLPRLDSSAAADFHMHYSQAVDGIPTFSQPAESARKDKSPRRLKARRSSDANGLDENDAGSDSNDAATDDLEAVARNLKSEPESPEMTKTKKKKRKRTKAHVAEQSEDPHVPVSGSLEADNGLATVAELPEVSPAPEEAIAMPPPELPDDAPAPSLESPTSHKKKKNRKKKKSKTDAVEETRLDLNEDPIAGSDDEVVIPSSGRPSRRRKSGHDDGGSSRKFKKNTPLPAVSRGDALAIEDVADEQSGADVVAGTQDAAASEARVSDIADAVSAPIDFLRRSREPEPYEIGEDKISPSVTRQERRTHRALSRSASASLLELPLGEQAPLPLSNGLSEPQDNVETETPPPAAEVDAMDVDTVDPGLGSSVDRAASEDARASASDYSGGLPVHHDEDQAMEDDGELPMLSQRNHDRRPASEAVDLMSTLEDDAPMTLASTQPQPATDDDRSRPDPSGDEGDERQQGVLPDAINGDGDDSHSLPAARSEKTTRNMRQRAAQARAAAKESRMALQFMLDSSRDAADASASEAMPESEAENHAEPGSTRRSVNNLLADGSSAANSDNHEAQATVSQANGKLAGPSDESRSTVHLAATQTPHAERSSAHTTPKSSRTYARQPKPTFFERRAEDTAQAFAELPSNELAATPKPSKPRAKRRLPVDVPDAESAPSKRRWSSRSGSAKAKTPKAPKDPNTPKNTPGRKKAPETAVRNSAGFLTGVFTKTEVTQVEGAVEAFRVDHEMEQHELNAMIQQNPKDPSIKDNSLHEELWSRVLEACPTRPRQKLLNWCRQKFHNFVARATWTPEQDEELRQMVKQYGTTWNVIGQHINRHQKDVRDRWRNYLVAGNNQRKHHWSEEEETEFLEIVGEVLGIFRRERERDPNNDMFKSGRTDEELIDWNVVAERMKHGRSRLQCQEKWRRMREANKINSTILAGQLEPDQRWRLKRARHEIASMSHADMYHIVLAIPNLDGGAKDDGSINWKAVLESQRKKYHRYTGMLLWHRLRQLVPDQETKNVQICAKKLINMYQSDGGTFSIPGDEAFDDAEEEELLAEDPPSHKRGPGKAKLVKGKARVVSEPFVHDSDSEDGEKADDGDSSRANYNETSPVPESGEQNQNEVMEDEDEASLDLADDAGHDARGSSVDLSFNPPANDGEQVDDLDPELERDKASSKSRKKTKAKPKPQDQEDSSGLKKHRKRYSGDMMLDASPQKTSTAFPSKRRKRARADEVDTSNGSADPARKNKKARRVSNAPPIEQEATVAEGAASSDDDMEDIPARPPQVV